MRKEIDCKCPSEKSFKCGKYCTKDSIACDKYKSYENNNHDSFNIKDCGNQNVITHRSFFQVW